MKTLSLFKKSFSIAVAVSLIIIIITDVPFVYILLS